MTFLFLCSHPRRPTCRTRLHFRTRLLKSIRNDGHSFRCRCRSKRESICWISTPFRDFSPIFSATVFFFLSTRLWRPACRTDALTKREPFDSFFCKSIRISDVADDVAVAAAADAAAAADVVVFVVAVVAARNGERDGPGQDSVSRFGASIVKNKTKTKTKKKQEKKWKRKIGKKEKTWDGPRRQFFFVVFSALFLFLFLFLFFFVLPLFRLATLRWPFYSILFFIALK